MLNEVKHLAGRYHKAAPLPPAGCLSPLLMNHNFGIDFYI